MSSESVTESPSISPEIPKEKVVSRARPEYVPGKRRAAWLNEDTVAGINIC